MIAINQQSKIIGYKATYYFTKQSLYFTDSSKLAEPVNLIGMRDMPVIIMLINILHLKLNGLF